MDEILTRELDALQENISKLQTELKDHLIEYAGFKGRLLGLAMAGSVIVSIVTAILTDKFK